MKKRIILPSKIDNFLFNKELTFILTRNYYFYGS